MASSQVSQDHRDPRVRPIGAGVLVGLVLAVLVAAALTKVWAAVVALGALLLALAIAGAVAWVLARRASLNDPAVQAVPEREREAMPEIFMTGPAGESGPSDDETALGDTAEAHDEINPHDLPRDHPGREAAEDEANGAEGTTQGSGERSPAREGDAGS